ncbi:mismatch repair endonuclease PMS2 [Haemaphysalis longicornis]
MSKEIKAIDRGTVHRICSGQVVLNLAIAVKELVENSIDAGAKNISVKLKDFGSKLVEVVDDGEGVDEPNFAGLTLKYHTSKLREFSDLEGVATFGFRGEALSSLCALCDVTISTCHKDASQGTLLKFDHHGVITSRSPCARERGTTVSLHNLFTTLPVRHREFLANLKREFGKMVTLLTGYCLVATGVNISCTNFTEGGRKQVVLNSQGSQTVRERVATVYGAKEVTKLLEIQQCAPTEEVLEEFSLSRCSAEPPSIRIEGYVSSCAHGSGRSSTDRQFIFINSRPCEMLRLTKLVNSVYHVFNRDQYPFLFLNIHLERQSVDVNVTPDKRSVFVHHEKYLLAIVKSSLLAMFQPIAATYERRDFSSSPSLSQSQSPILSFLSPRLQQSSPSSNRSVDSSGTPAKRSSSSLGDTPPSRRSVVLQGFKFRRVENKSTPSSVCDSSPSCSQSTISGCSQASSTAESECSNACFDAEMASDSPSGSQSASQNSTSVTLGQTKDSDDITSRISQSDSAPCPQDERVSSHDTSTGQDVIMVDESSKIERENGLPGTGSKLTTFGGASSAAVRASISAQHVRSNSKTGGGASGSLRLNKPSCNGGGKMQPIGIRSLDRFRYGSSSEAMEQAEPEETFVEGAGEPEELESSTCGEAGGEVVESVVNEKHRSDLNEESFSETGIEMASQPEEVDERVEGYRRTQVLTFSCESLARRLKDLHREGDEEKTPSEKLCRGFRATITPGDNAAAETELSRQISKDMFAEMKIVGQFNLGFIVAQLGEDLFIVDQHAADEKYNFETLQRDVVMETQRLLAPQTLELTAVNEMVLTENRDIFEKNGFGFELDESQPPGRRVRLVSVPVSGSWQFGKEDVDELIFMLSDNPHTICRPSKVRQMFASRACRKSVMVGTALAPSTMKKVVSHLGELHHPWNCPHGRPTMRHLINLAILPD